MRTQQQNKLYTTECKIHKVVLFSDTKKIGGKLLDIDKPGYRKVAVPLDVTLKGSIDFTHFDASNVTRTDSLIVITLPDPQITITASHIDFKGARQYVSTLRSNFTDEEITRLARQGEDSIRHHIEPLRTGGGFAHGWRHACWCRCSNNWAMPKVTSLVRFRKDFNNNDLIRRVRTLNTPAS